MSAARPLKPDNRLRLGHPNRLDGTSVQVAALVLGHLLVFVASIAHDEIVAEMVEAGWFLGRYAERFEILIGFLLFMCWSALTLRLVTVVKRATSAPGGTRPRTDESNTR